MTEALAELWHRRIREEWGFADQDGPTLGRPVPPAVPRRALLLGLPGLPRPRGQRHGRRVARRGPARHRGRARRPAGSTSPSRRRRPSSATIRGPSTSWLADRSGRQPVAVRAWAPRLAPAWPLARLAAFLVAAAALLGRLGRGRRGRVGHLAHLGGGLAAASPPCRPRRGRLADLGGGLVGGFAGPVGGRAGAAAVTVSAACSAASAACWPTSATLSRGRGQRSEETVAAEARHPARLRDPGGSPRACFTTTTIAATSAASPRSFSNRPIGDVLLALWAVAVAGPPGLPIG